LLKQASGHFSFVWLVCIALMEEDPETIAKKELLSIHPSLRSEIVQSIPQDEWQAMSIVEKLHAIKQRLPEVSDNIGTWEKEAAKTVASGGEIFTTIKVPPEPIEEQLSEPAVTNETEAETEKREYWIPKGRCPYGMDRGTWVVSEEEMRQHDSRDSCWISIDGQVYEVTEWLSKHPGGAAKILKYAGRDATDGFKKVNHSPAAMRMLQKFHVGRLEGAPVMRFQPEEAGEVDPNAPTVLQVLLAPEDDAPAPPTDPAGKAMLALQAIHPSIRAEILKDIDMQEWANRSWEEKLELVKENMPRVQEKIKSDNGFDSIPMQETIKNFKDVFEVSGSGGGKCPYGFDQIGAKPEAQGTTEKAEGAPEVCPISGKSGECPMQAMLKNKDGAPSKLQQKRASKKGKGQLAAGEKGKQATELDKADCVIA